MKQGHRDEDTGIDATGMPSVEIQTPIDISIDMDVGLVFTSGAT